jgi:hypothetical protein
VRIERTQRNGVYKDKEFDEIYVLRKDISISDFTVQKSEVQYVKYIPLAEMKKWVQEKREDFIVPTE